MFDDILNQLQENYILIAMIAGIVLLVIGIISLLVNSKKKKTGSVKTKKTKKNKSKKKRKNIDEEYDEPIDNSEVIRNFSKAPESTSNMYSDLSTNNAQHIVDDIVKRIKIDLKLYDTSERQLGDTFVDQQQRQRNLQQNISFQEQSTISNENEKGIDHLADMLRNLASLETPLPEEAAVNTIKTEETSRELDENINMTPLSGLLEATILPVSQDLPELDLSLAEPSNSSHYLQPLDTKFFEESSDLSENHKQQLFIQEEIRKKEEQLRNDNPELLEQVQQSFDARRLKEREHSEVQRQQKVLREKIQAKIDEESFKAQEELDQEKQKQEELDYEFENQTESDDGLLEDVHMSSEELPSLEESSFDLGFGLEDEFLPDKPQGSLEPSLNLFDNTVLDSSADPVLIEPEIVQTDENPSFNGISDINEIIKKLQGLSVTSSFPSETESENDTLADAENTMMNKLREENPQVQSSDQSTESLHEGYVEYESSNVRVPNAAELALLKSVFARESFDFDESIVTLKDFLTDNNYDSDRIMITILSDKTILFNRKAAELVFETAIAKEKEDNLFDSISLLKMICNSSVDPEVSNRAFLHIEAVLLEANLEEQIDNLIVSMVDKEKHLISLIRGMRAALLEKNRGDGSYV